MVMTRTTSSPVSMSRLIEYSIPARSLRKAASEGASPAFMRHGKIQEFVERVAGFPAESFLRGRGARPLRPSRARIKSKRTAAGPRPPKRELARGARMFWIRGGLQGVEKAAAPARRERHEIIIVESDERRFQHASERQIILRKQARAPGRHEIHDGDMLREFKPVGAGGWDVEFSSAPE